MTATRAYDLISSTFPSDYLSTRSKQLRCKRREYIIQEGISINRLQLEFSEKVTLKYRRNQPVLNFNFLLSGNYIHLVNLPGIGERQFIGSCGTSGVAYFPPSEGALVIPEKTPVHIIHFYLTLPNVFNVFDDEEESVPAELKAILQGTFTHPYVFFTGMSPATRSTLERLIQGPPQGAPSRLFYKGIVLNLIAEQIARLNTCPSEKKALLHHDQGRIIRARNLLTCDLSAPPNLKHLSRKTGLNPNKLQQGFRLFYGVSVKQYLQQYRMKEANRLFHETDMNVSQIAFEVGYTNASHFSSAYKKQFGILPKKHLNQIRERL